MAVAAGYEHLIDPRLAAALPKQLQLRDSALAAGYRAEEAGDLHVDAELAVRLAHRLDPDARADQVARALGDAAIALEVVDLGGSEGPEAIVAGNIFHCAVVLGSACPEIPPREVTVRLVLNGEARTAPAASGDLPARLVAAARVLAGVDERLEAGDWLITGSVLQTPVQAGDEIAAECTCLRRARVSIAGA